MRAVVQRVTHARVSVDGVEAARIGEGLAVLLGVHREDSSADVEAMADKLANLRVMRDDEGRMNRSVLETGGAVLVVSQFTLLGDARKGRRPSYVDAAGGAEAEALYLRVCERLEALGLPVQRGVFGAMMLVELCNDGPVTLLLDTRKLF